MIDPRLTFYTRFGDWFAWLCVIVSAMLLASTFRKTKGIPAQHELLIPELEGSLAPAPS